MASRPSSLSIDGTPIGQLVEPSPRDNSASMSLISGGDRQSIDSQDSDHEHPQSDQADRAHKRQRIQKACDLCRVKKMKCDGKLPRCSYCATHRTECLFTYSNKKRQPPRSAKYVEELEARVAHMESLLQSAGLLGVDGALPDSSASRSPNQDRSASATAPALAIPALSVTPSASSHTTQTRPPSHARPYLPNAEYAKRQRELESGGVEDLADEMCSLVTTQLGETKYIGSSSSMTILSPRGTQWVKEKTGDDGFQKLVGEMATKTFTWFHWKPEIFGDLFTRRTYQPLPAKEEAISLLKLYFEHCNAMFPLFHEPTFMHLAEKQYSHEPFEGSGWWACLNVAMAISFRMRAHANAHRDNDNAAEDNRCAWLYMKNALAVMPELTLRNNDLLSVQAIAGMALFLQGTPNPFLSFYFVGGAIRLAQGLGLHKRGHSFNLNEVETEQRKRVFWILYMMDKDISLRSGRPAAQDDDDMNIGLPSEEPADQVGTIMVGEGSTVGPGSAGRRVNLFRKLCEFSQIQSQVYKRLYAERASRQSDSELLSTIGDLDKQLEDWKDSMPADVRPEHEIKVPLPYALTLMILHFAYYNCLTTIHRTSILHGSWTARRSNASATDQPDQALNPRVFMSAALCVNAARASIMLLDKLPPLHNGYTWIIMYYPISALCQLFSNILQNPTDGRGESDLKLMQGVIEWLSSLSDEDSDEYVKRMKRICSEFERVSRMALDKAKREQQARGTKRSSDGHSVGGTIAQGIVDGPARSPAGRDGLSGTSRTVQAGPTSQGQDLGRNLELNMPGATQDGNMTGASSANGVSPWTSSGTPSSLDPQFAAMGTPQNANELDMNYVNMYGDMTMGGQLGNYGDSMFGGNLQQPFMPLDLLKMPMTYEFDWAAVWPQGFDLGFDESAAMPGQQRQNGL